MALGTKRKAAQRLSVNPISLPSGAVQEFAGASAPEGWLMCDGAEVSKTTYAALYAVIADTYGTPVDSNNFVLPDLRGEFVRGLDDMGTAQGARGVDSGRGLGSAQDDTTRRPRGTAFGTDNPGNHNHGGQTNTPNNSGSTDAFFEYSNSTGTRRGVQRVSNQLTVSNNFYDHRHTINSDGSHTHSITTGGDAETRPRNCAMNFIIKA